jgi:hypothetical protein
MFLSPLHEHHYVIFALVNMSLLFGSEVDSIQVQLVDVFHLRRSFLFFSPFLIRFIKKINLFVVIHWYVL